MVNASPVTLFNRITDLNGIARAVPEEHRGDLTIEGDSIRASYAGFTVAVRIAEKTPFSKVVFEDEDAPFHFRITFLLENAALLSETSLTISAEAELNLMMKTLLGGRIREFLDKIATAISTGQALG